MIDLIPRYIAKTIILLTLLVIALMVGLSYFINFLGELRDIGVGNYGIPQAALHSLLELPHNIYQFFPMVVLIGGLIGLGSLATHQEIIVMRVSGFSMFKLVKAVFSAALVLIVIGLLIGEVLGPRAHYWADQQKSLAESRGQAVATASGIWVHEGDNFFHIDQVLSHHHLMGITRYEFNDQHKLLASYYAKSMKYINKHWKAFGIVKTTLNQQSTTRSEMAEDQWNFLFNPTVLNIGLVEPDEMSLGHLKKYTQHLEDNGLQASEFQFNFWQRMLRPFTILVMLVLAIPFVFAGPRSKTMGLRIVLGIVVGFVFYILNALLGQLAIVFQLSPLLAALLPILLFASIGYFWMMRIR